MPDQLEDNEIDNLHFVQSSFGAGMNQDLADVYVGQGEYPLAINCDNREGGLRPVRAATQETGFPTGKLQGLYGFNDYRILFVAGRLYVKGLAYAQWTRVFPLQLSPNVERIYVQAVPASTFNFDRALTSADNIEGIVKKPLTVNGTQAGLVIQDGVNQPWILGADLRVRITQRQNQWTRASREYVPVGKQMIYAHDILFVIAPDGQEIYRSLTGRPLDFAVRIDSDGDISGDASSVSYAVSDEITTFIGVLPSNQLLIGTENHSYIVTVNREETIFGEPTFIKAYTLPSGIVNQFSTFEMLGDFGFIDYDGLRSFNAVAQDKTEAKSNIFSRKIRKLLEDIEQDANYVSAVSANGLVYMHLQTSRGYGILTYDLENRRWVSLHQLLGSGEQFKQLAVFRANRIPEIYGITNLNRLYRLYDPEASFAAATAYTRAAVATDRRNFESLVNIVEVTVDALDQDGFVRVTPIIDGIEKKAYERQVKIKRKALPYSAPFPVIWPISSRVSNLTVPYQGQLNQGWKTAAKVEWDCGGQLSRVGIHGIVDTQSVGTLQSGESSR